VLALLAVVAAAAGGAYFALRPAGASDQRWADGPVQAPAVAPPVTTLPPPAATEPPPTAGPAREPARAVPDVAPPPVPTGTLFVNATPWGSVYVDGRLVGNTPQTNLRLPAGTYTLRVVRDGFVPWQREVQVRSGDTVRITDIVLAPIQP
jgi:hypothetical protein